MPSIFSENKDAGASSLPEIHLSETGNGSLNNDHICMQAIGSKGNKLFVKKGWAKPTHPFFQGKNHLNSERTVCGA